MSRRAPHLILALASLLALVLPTACGSNDSQEARDLLQRAFRKQTRSADVRFDMRARLRGLGVLGDRPLRLTLTGPLRNNGARRLPSLDWRVHAEGAGRSLVARLVVVPENVFVAYRGATYEVGERPVRRFARRLRRDPGTNLSLRRLGVEPEHWIEDGEVEDGEEVGGDPTRKVSGKLSVERVLRDFREVLENPRFRSQVPTGAPFPRLTDEQIDEVKDAVEDPTFEVDVGRRDEVVRRMKARVEFELSDEQRRDAGGLRSGSVSLVLQQTNVNGGQRITPPSEARPLSELLRRLGIPPELLGGSGFAPPRSQ
jgi:hypothetical protein